MFLCASVVGFSVLDTAFRISDIDGTAVAADPIQPRAEIYVKDLMVTYDHPEKAFVAP